MLACEHHFCVRLMAGFQEECLRGAVGERGGDFRGGGEAAATVWCGGCGGGGQVEGFDD